MVRLVRNAAQCRACGDIIESRHRHDFVTCSCHAIFVDGGLDYVRSGGSCENFVSLAEYRTEDDVPAEAGEVRDELEPGAAAHFPECDEYRDPRIIDECICPALTAYELRRARAEFLLDEGAPYREAYRAGYDTARREVASGHADIVHCALAYNRGLDVAQAALSALPFFIPDPDGFMFRGGMSDPAGLQVWLDREAALAAIDVLRGENK